MGEEDEHIRRMVNMFEGNLNINSTDGEDANCGRCLAPGADGWIRPNRPTGPGPDGWIRPTGPSHYYRPPPHPHHHHHGGRHSPPPPPHHYLPPGSLPHYESPAIYEECEPPQKPSNAYGWRPPSHCSGTYTWVSASNGSIPPNAVKAGRDKDGGPIFAGRAFHEGDLLPAKVNPTHGGAFVPWGGCENSKFEYEVMCSSHVGWTSAEAGNVPPEAICIGQTADGERLFMGRTMHDGTLTPGKIQPSHGVLYIPYGGEELSFREYEVLVLL